MHPLHDYIARQVAEKLKSRSIVVWYDQRGEFQPFVGELRGAAPEGASPAVVQVGGAEASLAVYGGSMFEVRSAVEPLVSGDRPGSVVIYVPTPPPDSTRSVLMELECSGTRYAPGLKALVRNLLRERMTDGEIDEILERNGLSYADLMRICDPEAGEAKASILKGIYHDRSGRDEMIAAWVALGDRDGEIAEKGAIDELVKLIGSRIGLVLTGTDPLPKLRTITRRYLLVNEFRSDLGADAPGNLAGVAGPKTKGETDAIGGLVERLRTSHADAYVAFADELERELGLASAGIAAEHLGATDTFRFEERAVLSHVESLIADGRYDDAAKLIADRQRSFWLDRDLPRRAQWQTAQLMVELGKRSAEVLAAAKSTGGNVDAWIAAYAEPGNGWYRLDQAQRRLETQVAALDEDPAARPLGLVRRAYDDAIRALADGFVSRLAAAGWSTSSPLHQTRTYADVVSAQPRPVAYFLVDAMRYEMGAELLERLPESAERSIEPAVAALPTITPIGMAALLPGAAASFDVVELNGKLGARIEGEFLPDLGARRKFAEVLIPAVVDLTLAELLGTGQAKLETRLKGADVVVVRSQEIDAAGEGGFFQARRTMDTVIDDLVRAIKRLAAVGVQHAVVSADHGHLFAYGDREEALRVDSPGGATTDLHRRCWIGRGGMTPPGCIRVTARTLGYDSDLDLVFPPGIAVFKAGGDLGFHHGGPTLQELIVPVVTIRSSAPEGGQKAKQKPATVTGMPDAITNRIFSAVVQLGENLTMFSSTTGVQPMLISGGRQVGRAAMAIGAELDREKWTVPLTPGTPVTIGFMLTDDSVESLRLVIIDPETDAELYQSPQDIPVNLGVA